MSPRVRALIEAAIGGLEDNLYRAKCAARGHDASKQWGESGKTLQQIIDEYQTELDAMKAELKP